MWDSLVFKKSKEALGGKVRWAGTGSAPISGETLSFLKATLCTPIAEGNWKIIYLICFWIIVLNAYYSFKVMVRLKALVQVLQQTQWILSLDM